MSVSQNGKFVSPRKYLVDIRQQHKYFIKLTWGHIVGLHEVVILHRCLASGIYRHLRGSVVESMGRVKPEIETKILAIKKRKILTAIVNNFVL